MADPGPSGNGSTTTARRPPPPSTGGSSSPSTTPGTSTTPTTPTTPKDNTPPPRARGLKVSAPKPGQIVLTWTLVHPSDIAHVFVLRKPAGHCPTFPLQRTATQIGSLNPRTPAGRLERAGHDEVLLRGLHAGRRRKLGQPGDARRQKPGRPDPARCRDRAHHDRRPGRRRDPGVDEPAGCGARSGRARARLGVPALPVRRHGDRKSPPPHDTGRLRAAIDSHDVLRGLRLRQRGQQVGHRHRFRGPGVHADSTQATSPASPPDQSGSSGSSLPDIVGIIGGGAIVLAGLAYATLRARAA